MVYLPVHGKLFELDGLKKEAVSHGDLVGSGGAEWLMQAAEVIRTRIEMYPPGSIEFNLQALRYDPIPILEAHLSTPSAALEHFPTSEIPHLLQNERTKRTRWEFENSLRRHNHLGMVVGLLGALARASVEAEAAGENEGGKPLWETTVEGAKEKMKVRIEKRREMMKMAGKGGKMPGGFGDAMELDDL